LAVKPIKAVSLIVCFLTLLGSCIVFCFTKNPKGLKGLVVVVSVLVQVSIV